MSPLPRCFVGLVCATYAALALAYNALTPIGEAPDELAHVQYARLLLEERRLPAARDDLWQGHQAPLYYVALAAWSRLTEWASGCRLEAGRLPSRGSPDFPRTANFNALQHEATEAVGAWTCQEWAFHLLRVLSTGLTLGTILLTFAILREAAEAGALIAAGGAVAALLPSHVFISAMANNDALVNLLAAATTYLALVACRTGDAADLAKAAALAGIAATAKLSCISLPALDAVALVLRRDLGPGLRRPGRARWWLGVAALCAALPAALALRNVAQWGDPFGVAALEKNIALLTAAGANPTTSMAYYYLVEVPELVANGFAVAFGPINFRLPRHPALAEAVARVVAAGLLLSALVRGPWRAVRGRPFALLAAGFGLFFLTFLVPGHRYRWLQARYFFNQLPLLSLLAAIGLLAIWQALRALVPRLPDGALAVVVYAYLVLLNLVVLAKGVIPHLHRYVGATGAP